MGTAADPTPTPAGGGGDAPAPGPGRRAALIALPVAALAAGAVFLLLAPGLVPGTPWQQSPGSPARQRTDQPTGPVTTGSAPGPVTTDPVPVAAPSLDPPTAAVCLALVAALPPRLRDRERRQVTAGDGQNAAWGTPPTILRCGVPGRPVPPDAQLALLDGVCWYSADGTVWETADRQVPVTVTLAGVTGAPGQWVIELSAPIAATDPVTLTAPSGCH